jgi:opacity protein-like surface antigen
MRFTKIAAAGAALAMAAGMAMAVPASANQGGYGEGCTPGFWKNHLDWKSYDDNNNPTNDDFLPESDVEDALRIDVPAGNSGATYNFETMTSLEALQGGGGSGLEGATKILLRASVAAYLNADAALDFPLRRFTAGVDGQPSMQSEIQRVLDSGKRGKILEYAWYLDGLNNAGCPLS